MGSRCIEELIVPNDLASAVYEATRYAACGSDYFSVKVGCWEIRYDETEETKNNKEEGN